MLAVVGVERIPKLSHSLVIVFILLVDHVVTCSSTIEFTLSRKKRSNTCFKTMPPKSKTKSATSNVHSDTLHQPTISKYFSQQAKIADPKTIATGGDNENMKKDPDTVKSVHDNETLMSSADNVMTENLSEEDGISEPLEPSHDEAVMDNSGNNKMSKEKGPAPFSDSIERNKQVSHKVKQSDTLKGEIDDDSLMDLTQSYDLDSDLVTLPDYTEGDFGSCSEEEVDQQVGKQDTGAFVSKDSGSDSGEEMARPWQKKGAKSKKKTSTSQEGSKKAKAASSMWSFRSRADEDTKIYRDGYPGQKDDPKKKDNLRFYTGKICSYPDGDYINKIHEEWWGNYRLLERHHGYIQWLFPIREDGMNWSAQALQLHEAEGIKADPKARKRVLRSYELMLDFYGMRLQDRTTGQLARTKRWEERFDNLTWSSHNYLRITRILKSLGELGYEHLKTPFLQFVLEEALVKGTLERTIDSCRNYWIGTVKDDGDRDMLYSYIEDNS